MFCTKKSFLINPNNQLVYSNTACFKYSIYSKYSQIPHGAPPPKFFTRQKEKTVVIKRRRKKVGERFMSIQLPVKRFMYMYE